jgi:hypothetical protein
MIAAGESLPISSLTHWVCGIYGEARRVLETRNRASNHRTRKGARHG